MSSIPLSSLQKCGGYGIIRGTRYQHVSSCINLICWEPKYHEISSGHPLHLWCTHRRIVFHDVPCIGPEYMPRSFTTYWVSYWRVLGATCFASLSSTSPPSGLGRSSGAKEDKTPEQAGLRNGSCPNPPVFPWILIFLDTTGTLNISRLKTDTTSMVVKGPYGHRV